MYETNKGILLTRYAFLILAFVLICSGCTNPLAVAVKAAQAKVVSPIVVLSTADNGVFKAGSLVQVGLLN